MVLLFFSYYLIHYYREQYRGQNTSLPNPSESKESFIPSTITGQAVFTCHRRFLFYQSFANTAQCNVFQIIFVYIIIYFFNINKNQTCVWQIPIFLLLQTAKIKLTSDLLFLKQYYCSLILFSPACLVSDLRFFHTFLDSGYAV